MCKDPPVSSLLAGDLTPVNPIIFKGLDADMIKQTALHTNGAAGPSGLDAHAWRRLCSSFKSASSALCVALACVGRCLATSDVNPEGVSAFVACHLVPLDKCPGVRPNGIRDIPRRIIAKAILKVVGEWGGAPEGGFPPKGVVAALPTTPPVGLDGDRGACPRSLLEQRWGRTAGVAMRTCIVLYS